MSNNKDFNIEVNNNVEEKEEPKQPSQVDPTEELDVTRKARQAALGNLEEVLARAVNGSKIGQKDIKKVLQSTHSFMNDINSTFMGLMMDFVLLAQSIAQSEVNLFAVRTHLKSLIRVLEKKDIINEALMKEVHDNEIVPEEKELYRQSLKESK